MRFLWLSHVVDVPYREYKTSLMLRVRAALRVPMFDLSVRPCWEQERPDAILLTKDDLVSLLAMDPVHSIGYLRHLSRELNKHISERNKDENRAKTGLQTQQNGPRSA